MGIEIDSFQPAEPVIQVLIASLNVVFRSAKLTPMWSEPLGLGHRGLNV